MRRRRREVAWFSVLLILGIFLLLKAQCLADKNGVVNRDRVGSSSEMSPLMSHGSFKSKNGDKNDNVAESFGSEKRRVYTGPNPLHNR